MASGRRRTAVPEDGAAGEEKGPVEENPPIASDEQESEVATLRGRWELLSVLSLLRVLKPVIGSDLKLTPAEKIEMALIQPDSLLAQIHIALLKGIPPASKILDGPESEDAWVNVLCKTLEPCWQRVAEGEFPLNAANGEEISGYKELSATNRLRILKALCELRVEQYDAAYHVNDSLKDGAKISSMESVVLPSAAAAADEGARVVRAEIGNDDAEEMTVRVAAPGIDIEIPPEDGNTWKIYDQKVIVGSRFPRRYYRCTHRKLYQCPATKTVQRLDDDPYTFEVIYRGNHTCHRQPPSVPPSALQGHTQQC